MQIGLPAEDVAEVRHRLLVWMGAEGITYAQAARRCGLKPHQVRDFVGARGCASEMVVAAICVLPLDLAYQRPRVVPRM